jgi:hypothetical protein
LRNSAAPALINDVDLHILYLATLERLDKTDDLVCAHQLHQYAGYFLKQGWLIKESYPTHIMVRVFNGYDGVEIDIDERTDTFSYISPIYRSRRATGLLSEVSSYTLNIDEWLDSLTAIFEVEPARRARKRNIIDSHLWYLGEIRIGQSHQFAPLYVARRLPSRLSDWQQVLCNPIRPNHGIVLCSESTEYSIASKLPNNHTLCPLSDLLIHHTNGQAVCDQETLTRLLQNQTISLNAYFDEKTGLLKLKHLEKAITFSGIQKKIIRVFWNARDGPPLTWAEIKRESGSAAKSIDQAFNKRDNWTEWIERAGHGKLRIRT